jgi:preprotein translocase subunit SecE
MSHYYNNDKKARLVVALLIIGISAIIYGIKELIQWLSH